MTATEKISGPPGTGKSTALLNVVEQLLASGVAPESIVFTTFTRAGAYEARDRACARFRLPAQALPYFRTLHSLCLQLLPACQVMTPGDWCVLAKTLGLHFTVKFSQDEGIPRGHTRGDCLLALWNLGRVNCLDLDETFRLRHTFSAGLPELTEQEFHHFAASVVAYKTSLGKVDFTDLLENWLRDGQPVMADYIIVDEAQDLSLLQWKVVRKLAKDAKNLWIAGDDDQCIHEWNGAHPGSFIEFSKENHRVLPQSYRIPKAVHGLADSIIKRVQVRIPKEYRSREEQGHSEYIGDMEALDLKSGTWLLLARNQIFLKAYAELCRRRGLLFSGAGFKNYDEQSLTAIRAWQAITGGGTIRHDQATAMYLLMSQRDRVRWGCKKLLTQSKEPTFTHQSLVKDYGLLAPKDLKWHSALDMMPPEERAYLATVERHGELDKPMQIEISTIHGAKGREADHVALRLDMTDRTYQSYIDNPEPEHRVWYVGVTRARHSLYVINPETEQAYAL